MSRPLTPDETRHFRHCGFLKLPTPLSAERIADLKEAVWRDIRAEAEPVVRHQGRIVRLSNLWDRDPIFRKTIESEEILVPLRSLLGENIEYLLNRHNHATLRIAGDSPTALHRDTLQWSRTIVTVLVYLEETNLDNGCTRVVPGTHLLPGVSMNVLEREAWARESGLFDQTVAVPMPAGGLLAIDGMIWHGPGENRTPNTRMSMTLGYHSVDELTDQPNPKRALVSGTRPYGGNDRATYA